MTLTVTTDTMCGPQSLQGGGTANQGQSWGWFNFVMPQNYNPGDDFTVEFNAYLFNDNGLPFVPGATANFVGVRGMQFGDTNISNPDVVLYQPPTQHPPYPCLKPGQQYYVYCQSNPAGPFANFAYRIVPVLTDDIERYSVTIPGRNIVPPAIGFNSGGGKLGPDPTGTYPTNIGVIEYANLSVVQGSSPSEGSSFAGASGTPSAYLGSDLAAFNIPANSRSLQRGSQVSICFWLNSFNDNGVPGNTNPIRIAVDTIEVLIGLTRTPIKMRDEILCGFSTGVPLRTSNTIPLFSLERTMLLDSSTVDIFGNPRIILVDMPVENLTPQGALIPLPPPVYAENKRLIFYPWDKGPKP